MKNKLENYKRNCPNCGIEIIYKTNRYYKDATKNDTNCRICCNSGENHGMYGKHHTEETRIKMKLARANYTHSAETKQKISIGKIGDKNPFYGKFHTDTSRQKMSLKGKFREKTNETKLKMRLSTIEYIEQRQLLGGQLQPNYNISSIPILEQTAKELGITDLQHAENGGEYYIKELGYWVDGYSKEKNIVIEYYEKHHNRKIEKDLQRQEEITNLLKCEFMIISEK